VEVEAEGLDLDVKLVGLDSRIRFVSLSGGERQKYEDARLYGS
jgi:hypothetical protein